MKRKPIGDLLKNYGLGAFDLRATHGMSMYTNLVFVFSFPPRLHPSDGLRIWPHAKFDGEQFAENIEHPRANSFFARAGSEGFVDMTFAQAAEMFAKLVRQAQVIFDG